jgi:hypothetical protein
MSNIDLIFTVIPPQVTTDATLASSSVPEPGPADPAAWVSAGNYAVNDRRHRIVTHRIYECIQAHTGRTALPEVDTAFWREVEYTQRWKMFDRLRTIPTVHTSPMVVELEPGVRCNAWFVTNVIAEQVTVSMIDGASTVYTKTLLMTRRNTRNWSDYFFGTFDPVRIALDDEMPLIASATIRFEFTSSTGTVSVGRAAVGRSVRMGSTEVGADLDADNYSQIERSEVDGSVTNLVQRRNLPRNVMTVFFDPEDVDLLISLRDSLVATPVLWSAMGTLRDNPYFSALSLFGIYKRFRLTADGLTVGRLSLEVEEM